MTAKRDSHWAPNQASRVGTYSISSSSNFFRVPFVVFGLALPIRRRIFTLLERRLRKILLIFSSGAQNVFASASEPLGFISKI